MPKININRFNTYYELHGQGKKTLVFISGLMGDHSSWLPIINNFSQEYQVLIFDSRGVGQATSSGYSYSVKQMAHDTISLLDTLNIKKPIIIGHSLGGAIAQYIAINNSNHIESLILCNSFPKFNEESCKLFKSVISLYENNAPPSQIFNSFAKEVLSEEYLADKERFNKILQSLDESKYKQSLDGYMGQFSALSSFNSRDLLESISAPTLVIHAKLDKIVSLENATYLSSHIRKAKLELLPGGHATQIEYPDLLCTTIKDFLTTL